MIIIRDLFLIFMALLIRPLAPVIDHVSNICWFGKIKCEKGGWVSHSAAAGSSEIEHIVTVKSQHTLLT